MESDAFSSSVTDNDLIRSVRESGFQRWREQLRSTGGCSRPIYLSGHRTVYDASSGEVLHSYDTRDEPGGRLVVRCNNRRAGVCPTCSRTHSGDTFQLVRAGLIGGKGVPGAVAAHPRLFVTLTAPGFGSVHRSAGGGRLCRPRRGGGQCAHGRPVGCRERHGADDPLVGQPLCPDCYDYSGHVLWHAYAGALWSRWCDTVRRHLAMAFGIARSRLRDFLVVSFAKVAEYQARAAVHFHCVIRLDGADGPGSLMPEWASSEALEAAIYSATRAVEVQVPYTPEAGEYVIRFGKQIDVHPISGAMDGPGIAGEKVAAYVAKYVSKSVGTGSDSRIRSAADIAALPVSDHVRTLMFTCWRLGGLKEFEALRMRRWVHTLGYRGHIMTKSRQYSTTYSSLRTARAKTASGWVERPTSAIQSSWRYSGSGHTFGVAVIAEWISRGGEPPQNGEQEYTSESPPS